MANGDRERKQLVESKLEDLRSLLTPVLQKHLWRRYGESWRDYVIRAEGASQTDPLDLYATLTTLIERWGEFSEDWRRIGLRFDDAWTAKKARNRIAHFAGELPEDQARQYINAVDRMIGAIVQVQSQTPPNQDGENESSLWGPLLIGAAGLAAIAIALWPSDEE